MIVPFDIRDRESLLDTLDDMKQAVSDGQIKSYAIIAINKDGTCTHGHNAELDEFPALIGWLEIKKKELMERYE